MAKKFTELTTASQINETDITAISQETGGVWGSFKATISTIAQKIITGINFANAFNTSDKTVAGAVNEKLTSTAVAYVEVSPAESAHSVGDYIIYNGIQYKVTSAIAIGDSLVINTNIEAETLDTRINNIDSKIDDSSYYHVGDVFETQWLQWMGLTNNGATTFDCYMVLPKAIGSDVTNATITIGNISNVRVNGINYNTGLSLGGGGLNSVSGIINFYINGSYGNNGMQAGQISCSNFKVTFY